MRSRRHQARRIQREIDAVRMIKRPVYGTNKNSAQQTPPRKLNDKNLKDSGSFLFWYGEGQQGNDNPALAQAGPKLTQWLTIAMLVGALLALSSSQVITNAVLYSDSHMMRAAMSVSPAAVGFVLNRVDIGE